MSCRDKVEGEQNAVSIIDNFAIIDRPANVSSVLSKWMQNKSQWIIQSIISQWEAVTQSKIEELWRGLQEMEKGDQVLANNFCYIKFLLIFLFYNKFLQYKNTIRLLRSHILEFQDFQDIHEEQQEKHLKCHKKSLAGKISWQQWWLWTKPTRRWMRWYWKSTESDKPEIRF